MTQAKYTPGPWALQYEPTSTAGVRVRFDIRSATRIAIASGQSQEHLGEDVGVQEVECIANARLIAAAPELLEALQETLGYFPAEFRSQLEKARAAIAKATGAAA